MSGGGIPISVVGSPVSQTVSGANNTPSLAVTTTTNDLLVYVGATIGNTSNRAMTAVSGGGVTTWNLAASTNFGTLDWLGLWWGVVTTGGPSNITCTVSTPSDLFAVAAVVQEFSGGSQWLVDGSGASRTNTSSTTVTYPTLAPVNYGRGYFGGCLDSGTASGSGQTAGYTVAIATGSGGTAMLYNPAVAGSQSPTSTQSPTNTSATVAALIYALNPTQPPYNLNTSMRRAASW